MIRSLLFIPGNSPSLLVGGGFLGADALILDLEDAVAPAEKDAARLLVQNAVRWFKRFPVRTIVRVNALDTPYFRADIQTVLPAEPDMIMLPKSGTRSDIEQALSVMSVTGNEKTALFPLVETALGIENAYSIAASSPRVYGLLLGAEDLTRDLHTKRTGEGAEIAYARGRIVCAARAAGKEVYDTPFTDVNDDAGILADTETAKSFGFTGKASISPRHIDPINRIFSPSPAEIREAQDIVRAAKEAEKEGRGVIALNGKMIDAPVLARAEQVLASISAPTPVAASITTDKADKKENEERSDKEVSDER